ncbi:MAG: hypothetical protein RMK01_02130 [Thermomicrobium sp.]|nr:hypothetical protein [Thermomicrobium sp.]MDW8058855.1 hypothetical protein [Thermomicrobium sp.]
MKGAVRRLGSARLEWAELPESTRWVAVPGPLGDEVALVVAAGPVFGDDATSEPIPARLLAPDEVDRLPALLERALAVAATLDPASAPKVRGVRPVLAGGFVLEFAAEAAEVERAVRDLAPRLGVPVRGVAVGTGRALSGGLGRLAVFGDPLQAAVDRLATGEPDRPGGFPRIGAVVATPRGEGIVWAVRTRDRTVLVRIGEETVRFSVDEVRTLR